jgi:glycosyltransferase involved in cell wall biosynthesis
VETSLAPAPTAGEIRRVLLVEPVFHVHALAYIEAALASVGFENARIVVATCITDPKHRERMAAFAAKHPRLELRLLDGHYETLTNRLANWRAHRGAMKQVEAMLRREQFDLVIYMMMDCILPFVAFSIFRRKYRAHWAARISGLVFRDNGLRPPTPPTFKARLRASFDRFVLDRAVHSPAVRKLAFLDPWCAARALERWPGTPCRAGVDAIKLREPVPDSAAARALLGVPEGAFAVLLFGSFSDRKGIVPTLEILRDTTLLRPLCVLLGGPVEPVLRGRFDTALNALKSRHTVRHYDGFVPDAELPDYFAAADTVICAYKDFTGSSGVLLHAASFGKPALVSPGGVMADAIERHRFGEIVHLEDPTTFNIALTKLSTLNKNERTALRERALSYARLNDSRRYLSQFL